MKKIRKILIILLFSLFIFVIFDVLFFYFSFYQKFNSYKTDAKYIKNEQERKDFLSWPKYFIKLIKFKNIYEDYERGNCYRPVQNPESKEKPIVIFGCSFAFGYLFDNKETISYIMSKYSKRPIINRSMLSWGIQHSIYQLRDKNFTSSVCPPKYVFYILITATGHMERLYYTNFPSIMNNDYYFTYKNINGQLVENKPILNLYYGFSIPRHVYNKLIYKKVQKMYTNNDPKLFDFLILHFKTMNDLIKKCWGNDTKLVILTFENTKKELWASQLNEMGIDVIDIAETIGVKALNYEDSEYFSSLHPNVKLWKELVPKLKEIYPDL